MILPAVFGGKKSMTTITGSPAALTNGDGDQSACRPVARSAIIMLRRRSTNRHAGWCPLRPGMTTGAVGGQANQRSMIFGRVSRRKVPMTRVTSTTSNVTGSRSSQGTIGVVAGGARFMDFRVVRIDSVTSGGMTTGTVRGHSDQTGMVDAGMVRDKAAMTDRAIAAAIMTTDASAYLTGGRTHQSTVTAMAGGTGVVSLRVTRNNGITGRGVTTGTVGVHADHGIVIDRGMVVNKGAMAG